MTRYFIRLIANNLSLRLMSIVYLMWLVSGCGYLEQTGLGSETDQAQEIWRQHDIESYTIEVRVIQSVWSAQTYKITVVNGEVVSNSAECIPGPAKTSECEVAEYDPQDYTVPGLFAIARSESQKSEGQFTTIKYDPTYGFPTRISYDDPEVFDEDRSWKVLSFEVGNKYSSIPSAAIKLAIIEPQAHAWGSD